MRTVFASLRRLARTQWGVRRSQCGAVTFVQRAGDALNPNIHFHSLVLDGVYVREGFAAVRFLRFRRPTMRRWPASRA